MKIIIYNWKICVYSFVFLLFSMEFSSAEILEETIHSRLLTIPQLEELLRTEEGRAAIKEEYHKIPTGARKTTLIASLEHNIKKNRYMDLFAYDETRVILERLPDDPYSDYINANYLDGYNRQKEYVATQGPLPNTINDFWRMIWQLNTKKIIMLANVIEHGSVKVEKYWPEQNATYGNIVVTKINKFHVGTDNVIRTFSLRKSDSPETRIVRQFHYTGWPDMGVPLNKISLIGLIEQAKKYEANNPAPVVIHCSAGVGRTGTVILMDSQIEKAKAENRVNFPKKLDHMRNQRIDMVEKEEQYLFAHETVNEIFNDRSVADALRKIDEEYAYFANRTITGDEEVPVEEFEYQVTAESRVADLKGDVRDSPEYQLTIYHTKLTTNSELNNHNISRNANSMLDNSKYLELTSNATKKLAESFIPLFQSFAYMKNRVH